LGQSARWQLEKDLLGDSSEDPAKVAFGRNRSGGPLSPSKEGAQVAGVARLQERIAGMMLGGASLDRVEMEVIDESELKEDQKAALWLYAWSFMEGQEQRAQAKRYLVGVGA
jgi:hypothetical protein